MNIKFEKKMEEILKISKLVLVNDNGGFLPRLFVFIWWKSLDLKQLKPFRLCFLYFMTLIFKLSFPATIIIFIISLLLFMATHGGWLRYPLIFYGRRTWKFKSTRSHYIIPISSLHANKSFQLSVLCIICCYMCLLG